MEQWLDWWRLHFHEWKVPQLGPDLWSVGHLPLGGDVGQAQCGQSGHDGQLEGGHPGLGSDGWMVEERILVQGLVTGSGMAGSCGGIVYSF